MSTDLIAIVARAEVDRRAYEAMLREHGAEARLYQGLADLKRSAGNARYRGVLVDLKAIIGCSQEERGFLRELDGSFPVLRVQRQAGGRLSGIFGANHGEGEEVLVRFLGEIQARFAPRGLRENRRKPLSLSVLVAEPGGRTPSVHACTQDASERGLFLVLPEVGPDGSLRRTPGEAVYLSVPDLGDAAPIETVVRWGLPWGTSMRHVPGYGLEFTHIGEIQESRLCELLRDV
jgi:hypothetical protein